MRRHLIAPLLFVLALIGGHVVAHAQGAADPARIAAAKDMMQAVGITKQMESMMGMMAQQMAAGVAQQDPKAGEAFQKKFGEFTQKFMSYQGAMLEEFAAVYAERFTAEELTTIANFYKSGPGAKFVQLSPELIQVGGAIGARYGQKAMAEVMGAPQ